MGRILSYFAGGQGGKHRFRIAFAVIRQGQMKHFFHHVYLYGNPDRGNDVVYV